MESNLEVSDKGKVGIYLIHNPNTAETYVGSGKLIERKSYHERTLKNGTHHNFKLQAAYNRNPDFVFNGLPIEDKSLAENRELALNVEQEIINEHWGNPLLLNIARDVEKTMLGYKHSEESVEKNRQAAITRWADPEYAAKVIAAQRAGHAAMSEETRTELRTKQSANLQAAYASGARVSNAGQTRSVEFCENNSSQIKKLWDDPEYRERQRLGRIGKMVPPTRTRVVINNTEYDSLTSAAVSIGMSKQGVKYRIESPNFPQWKNQG